MTSSTQIQLAQRPTGWPDHENFRTAVVDLPALGEGEVRVANDFISVDPYMRGRMNDNTGSYIPPFNVGEVMGGGAVGRVIESRDDSLAEGTLVLHDLGWRDVAQGPAAGFRAVQELPGLPASVYLGALGMTGLTAWVGLLEIASMKEGDTVFVSGAAGAVGTMVGQIARLKGAARVIGSAGSPEKIELLTSKYGFDTAFNYKDGDIAGQLAAAAPEGIDVYFDNVGGEHLEAALGTLKTGGRVALCGAISQYNITEPEAGPRNMANLITKGLRLQGFTVGNYTEHLPAFAEQAGAWLAAGELVFDETVVEGLDHAVDAFLDLMRGANTGKMVVKL
ncbi:MAG: NADP-dependent oxidoreductase [Arthrobacter sp.]|uniref:NADP-dependent oxidoreductase n=1 Tax=Arthrobacter TaxID=1663 RepID=UPI002655916F|nr:NADP-dependent oxidoreductase [Micrococcaceae bacterium]MDN5811920.1 NADP-dependent oxidoreductase [Micrococcaceae bacterium]MDN5880059.1 NADP-dependent oxidoreductase [Micrococcaceae bacterium]MDN5888023.1 NADP-dependent oxidoreductase [Micrococcaceae bacterium]MDN5905531.1 NADP-dependent oxidoreductase [Micrococcaceae bacterium]